ncbi:hypothetical protein ACHAXR_002338 [Thalassiosira sp. AJA248-18]
MIHRLYQLFSTSRGLDTFDSMLHFRDVTRKKLKFWKSLRHLESSLCSMAAAYDPVRSLVPTAVHGQVVRPSTLPGSAISMHGLFPPTGQSPQRKVKAWYQDRFYVSCRRRFFSPGYYSNHLAAGEPTPPPVTNVLLLLVLDLCNVDQLPSSQAGKAPSEPRLPTHAMSIPINWLSVGL